MGVADTRTSRTQNHPFTHIHTEEQIDSSCSETVTGAITPLQ